LNEDQQLEAIKSLAVELHRLSHVAPTPNELDDDFNVAVIVRGLTPTLPEQPRGVSKNSPLFPNHDDTNREGDAHTVPSARLVEKAQHRIFARERFVPLLSRYRSHDQSRGQ
jgi:hypothetical protein